MQLKLYIYGYLNGIQSSRRLKNTQKNIDRYLAKLDAVDREEPELREVTAKELKKKIASMEAKMTALKQRQEDVDAHPDKQISTTDEDARSMMKAGGGSVVGCNVQTVVADAGYYKSKDIRGCQQHGITALVPKPSTSNNKAAGLYDKKDFRYDAKADQYRCPAGEILPRRHSSKDKGNEDALLLCVAANLSSVPPEAAMHDRQAASGVALEA